MTARVCLFIGGCWDGQRRVIPDEAAVWEALPETVPPCSMATINAPIRGIAVEVHRYQRRVMRLAHGAEHLFTFGDMPDHEIFRYLVEGYRRP